MQNFSEVMKIFYTRQKCGLLKCMYFLEALTIYLISVFHCMYPNF